MTSSVLNKEQQEVIRPEEDIMLDRKGFDTRGFRREMAATTEIDRGTKFVQQGEARYVHPDSDMPTGPTGVGEVIGNVHLVQETGSQVQIPRYTHGFTFNVEDGEPDADADQIQQYRDSILELFDLKADLAFLNGLDDEAGNTVFDGVFQFLHDESSEVIDCSNFDPSAGELQGVPANIILQEAYQRVSGRYVGATGTWDIAAAKHPVWADWNQVGTFDGADLQSQWDVVQGGVDDAGVSVRRQIRIPDQIGLQSPTSMTEDLNFDVTMPTRDNSSYDSDIGDLSGFVDDDDQMYLIPEHNGDFYELYEEPEPELRGPLEKEGFTQRVEYKWRGGVVQGLSFDAENTVFDVVVLENVTALFDNS